MQNAECRRIRRNDFCILHSAFCISSYLHKRKLPRTRINGHRLLRLVPRRQDGDPNDHDECKMQNADGFDATTSAFCILPSAFRHISTNENAPEPGSMAIASPVSYHGGRMVIRAPGVGSTSFWWKWPKTTSVKPSAPRSRPYRSK